MEEVSLGLGSSGLCLVLYTPIPLNSGPGSPVLSLPHRRGGVSYELGADIVNPSPSVNWFFQAFCSQLQKSES